VTSGQAFTYFRIVVNQLNGYNSGAPVCVLAEIILNGTIEGVNVTPDGRLGLGVSAPVQALEVAGNMVVNGTVSHQSTTFRNVLINGDFRINQRGISTNVGAATYIATSGSSYTLDRWACFRAGFATNGYVAQGSAGTTDLPYQNDGLTNFMRIGRSAGDTSLGAIYILNPMESRDSYRLAGKTVTLSFYYRTGSAFAGTLNISTVYGTGTDQTPSNWTGSVTVGTTSITAVNTSWTKVSASASIPINATQTGVQILYIPTTATAVANDYFDVTGVQLEKGNLATNFEIRPYATELALCQRYYQKSYQQGDYAGTVNTANGIITASAVNVDSIGGTRFNVPMRTTPATTIYSTNGTAGKASVFASGADTSSVTTVYVTNVGIGYVYINASNLTQGNGYRYQYVADAEL